MIKKNSFFLSFLFCVLLTNGWLFGQSLVINEVSQGPTGSREYVEFLVIPGSNTYNCNDYCLDLRGWIIDDNNGYFSNGGGTGKGIAAGASRFSNDLFWSCIPVGTIIVIYNDVDRNVAIPADDISLSDGNCRLVLPISSNLLESQSDSPSLTVSTYPTTNWTPGGTWAPVGMANGGDSFQTISPTNLTVPVHGVSWTSSNNFNNIIYFPNSASNSVYYFTNLVDNNPSNQDNWVAGTCSGPDDQTPGSPNNTSNAAYIQSLTNNCAGPLDASLQSKTDAGSCQCNGNATVSVIGSIPNYSYNWFDATNNAIGQTTSTASNLCAGDYYCVVRSSINCLDTLHVTINSSTNTITPNFNQISPICVGGSISLPTTSTNNIKGSWTPNIDNTQTTAYTFTPDAGQCASSTTMTVVVSTGITPSFNQIPPICFGENFVLVNTSIESITGVWSPQIDNTQTTTYTFTPDPNQCANSTTMIVEVKPIPQVSINENPTICSGESTILTTNVSSIGGSFLWSPGNQNTSQITVSPALNTTYTVVYSLNGCASAAATATVTVNANVTPQFNPWGPYCQDAILAQVILPETSLNGIDGTWNPQMVSTAISGNISYTFTPDAGQCAGPITMIVQVYPKPTVFAGSDLVICEGSSIVLNATGAVTYTWDGGVTNNLSFTPLSNATYTATGIDANGCEATDEVTVTLIPKPQPVLSPNVLSGTNPLTVEFSNQSLNALSYTWNFGNGAMVNTPNLSSVQYEFTTLGNHEVWLVATNGICSDSISTIITVYELGDPVIEVPNVFTPNGDNANETWSINTVNINEIEVIILNRWGGQIAEINDLHGAWDGKTSYGDDATDGTYYYKYLAKAINGKEFTGHGFITLVR